MFAVTRLRADGYGTARRWPAPSRTLLAALSARPGFRDGELGRSADDPDLWALVTRWDGVGWYRRGAVGGRGEDRGRTRVGPRRSTSRVSTSPTDGSHLRSVRGQPDPHGQVRPPTQAADGCRRARPHDGAVDRPQAAWGGCAYCGATGTSLQLDCGRDRVLPIFRPGRPVHAGQRRPRLRLVQRQQSATTRSPPGCGASAWTSAHSWPGTSRSVSSWRRASPAWRSEA